MKKRLATSDSLAASITVSPSSEDQSVYGRDAFQYSMVDGVEEEEEEAEQHQRSEKKRRLKVDQVKALEKNFEVENKLEPERKVKLAQELGLEARQVAVWFQNRRARWKTKQLERDYGVLKGSYDALKVDHHALKQDNQTLHNQIKELKSRLLEKNTPSSVSVKEEEITRNESEDKMNKQIDPCPESSIPESESNDHLNFEFCFNDNLDGVGASSSSSLFPSNFKDGASDSDSSVILNDDNNSPKAVILCSGSPPLKFNYSISSPSPSSSMSCLQFQKPYQQTTHYVKMEENNFLGTEEACNFFLDEQAPTLHWYCSDH